MSGVGDCLPASVHGRGGGGAGGGVSTHAESVLRSQHAGIWFETLRRLQNWQAVELPDWRTLVPERYKEFSDRGDNCGTASTSLGAYLCVITGRTLNTTQTGDEGSNGSDATLGKDEEVFPLSIAATNLTMITRVRGPEEPLEWPQQKYALHNAWRSASVSREAQLESSTTYSEVPGNICPEHDISGLPSSFQQLRLQPLPQILALRYGSQRTQRGSSRANMELPLCHTRYGSPVECSASDHRMPCPHVIDTIVR
jgi:hypothetical protein